MAKTVADPHVLQATNQPNMLQNLEEANGLLDEIMKGCQLTFIMKFENILIITIGYILFMQKCYDFHLSFRFE